MTHEDDGLPGDPALPRLIIDSYERLTGASLLPADVRRDEAAAFPRWRDADPGGPAGAARA